MTEVTQESHPWVGRDAFDANGERVGKVGDVYLERRTHLPAWVVVQTGRLGTRKVFVPVEGAIIDDAGVKSGFSQQLISGAPRPAADGSLAPAGEAALLRHYELEVNRPSSTGGMPAPAAIRPVRVSPPDRQLPAEMIRSEEELRVTTVSRPAEVVRIRKIVVTEDVTLTVSLRREEIRVEHMPISAGVTDGELADLTTQAYAADSGELVLLEEQPVIEKRLVPYERVCFTKEVVTEERQVSDEVRKERITTDREPMADHERRRT